MTDIDISNNTRLMREMIEGINQAAGGCSQLTHQLQAPQFILIRRILNATSEGILKEIKFPTRRIVRV